jgi:hypothetical protein
MNHDRQIALLGGFLGAGFIVMGIVESAIAINGNDSIVFFWFPALCGGGLAILLGVFKVRQPARLSVALITLGAATGGLAMAWTLIVPLLAIALVVLVWRRQPLALSQ